jgi:hypothetical protein
MNGLDLDDVQTNELQFSRNIYSESSTTRPKNSNNHSEPVNYTQYSRNKRLPGVKNYSGRSAPEIVGLFTLF